MTCIKSGSSAFWSPAGPGNSLGVLLLCAKTLASQDMAKKPCPATSRRCGRTWLGCRMFTRTHAPSNSVVHVDERSVQAGPLGTPVLFPDVKAKALVSSLHPLTECNWYTASKTCCCCVGCQILVCSSPAEKIFGSVLGFLDYKAASRIFFSSFGWRSLAAQSPS